MGKSRVGYGGPPQQENRDEDEDRFVYEDDHARELFGDRYDEFKERFERAVNAVDIDALCDLAADFADANLPWCREKSRENKKRRGARCCTAKQEDTEVEQRAGSEARMHEKFRQRECEGGCSPKITSGQNNSVLQGISEEIFAKNGFP